MGGASYINAVVCRDKDANTAWTAASDGTLEECLYYCQNWRGDVVALVDSSGQMTEWVKASAYGIPIGLPAGDTDSDGDCDATDANQIQTWINQTTYNVRGDLDLDGDVDSTDKLAAQNNTKTLGWGVLSDVANRCGYAGYWLDEALSPTVYHVRHRVLHSDLGRWTRRDPLGYVDGVNVYEYLEGRLLGTATDPEGLQSQGPTQGPGAVKDQCPADAIPWVVDDDKLPDCLDWVRILTWAIRPGICDKRPCDFAFWVQAQVKFGESCRWQFPGRKSYAAGTLTLHGRVSLPCGRYAIWTLRADGVIVAAAFFICESCPSE
jgi:RHS repeat-associated protein